MWPLRGRDIGRVHPPHPGIHPHLWPQLPYLASEVREEGTEGGSGRVRGRGSKGSYLQSLYPGDPCPGQQLQPLN